LSTIVCHIQLSRF